MWVSVSDLDDAWLVWLSPTLPAPPSATPLWKLEFDYRKQ